MKDGLYIVFIRWCILRMVSNIFVKASQVIIVRFYKYCAATDSSSSGKSVVFITHIISKIRECVIVNCVPLIAMMTSSNGNISALLAFCVGNSHRSSAGEFPAQRPVARRYFVFFYLRLNKQLSKQSHPLWHQCNGTLLEARNNTTSGLIDVEFDLGVRNRLWNGSHNTGCNHLSGLKIR